VGTGMQLLLLMSLVGLKRALEEEHLWVCASPKVELSSARSTMPKKMCQDVFRGWGSARSTTLRDCRRPRWGVQSVCFAQEGCCSFGVPTSTYRHSSLNEMCCYDGRDVSL
jgi:hypothetical protein